jgi:hypothetical protein
MVKNEREEDTVTKKENKLAKTKFFALADFRTFAQRPCHVTAQRPSPLLTLTLKPPFRPFRPFRPM